MSERQLLREDGVHTGHTVTEKLWPDPAHTARWLSPQPGPPTRASRARVSFSTTMDRNTKTGKPGIGR